MNDKIEEMCKAAVDAINVSYEDYDQDSDLYEGFMEGFNAAWKELTAERDALKAEVASLTEITETCCKPAQEECIRLEKENHKLINTLVHICNAATRGKELDVIRILALDAIKEQRDE